MQFNTFQLIKLSQILAIAELAFRGDVELINSIVVLRDRVEELLLKE